MIEFFKSLLGLGRKPDVLLTDCSGGITLHVSRIVAGRRIVDHRGGVLLLADDGKVRGSSYTTSWEEL
jgi:hypothetical protein